jgi:DNA repair exonuclease SbcCD ATPase subunit/DNA repair exonuclease SbcCD nuclease subunit
MSKIYHISDVHIRNAGRREEYETVFRNLRFEIAKTATIGDVVVVTGDIVDAKNRITVENVRLQRYLYFQLHSLMVEEGVQVVVIPGNHDGNLKTPDAPTALETAIGEFEEFEYFHFIRNTRSQKVGDFNFYHYSLFDVHKEEDVYTNLTNEMLEDGGKSGIPIALYHGVVNGCYTEGGRMLESDMGVDFFHPNYEAVLLGDIHKPNQIMDAVGRVRYPGSLIQQNFGEGLVHGILAWEFRDKQYFDAQFLEIPNEYKFLTINLPPSSLSEFTRILTDGFLTYAFDAHSKFRIRLVAPRRLSVFEKTAIDGILNKIATDFIYEIIDVKFQENYDDVGDEIIVDGDDVEDDIRTHVKAYFERVLQDSAYSREEVTRSVKVVSEMIETQLNADINTSFVPWKMDSLRFENMFRYEEHELNFSEFGDGLISITGENASGKSAILDIISVALFDKTPRGISSSVMREGSNDGSIVLYFTAKGDKYRITRNFKRGKTGSVKIDVDFCRVLEDGELELLNGTQRNETNANIREYVGEYENFILTNYMSQTGVKSFVELSNTNRIKYLNTVIGLGGFDSLTSDARKTYTEKKGVFKHLTAEYDEGRLSSLNEQLVNDVTTFNHFESNEYAKIHQEVEAIADERLDMERQYASVSGSISQEYRGKNPDQLVEQYTKALDGFISNVEDFSNSLNTQEQVLSERMINKEAAFDLLQQHQTTDIDTDKLEGIKERGREILSIKKDYDLLKSRSEILAAKIVELNLSRGELASKLNADCDVCMSNVALSSLLSQIKEKGTELSEVTTKIEALELMPEVSDHYNLYNVQSKLLIEEKSRIESWQSKLHTLQGELTKATTLVEQAVHSKRRSEDSIAEYKQRIEKGKLALEDVKKNAEAMRRENELSIELSDVVTRQKHVENSHRSAKNTLESYERRVNECKREITRLGEGKDKVADAGVEVNVWKLVTEALGKGGIIARFREGKLKSLVDSASNILKEYAGFEIRLEQGGGKLEAAMSYDGSIFTDVAYASGMERFLVGLALRQALITRCKVPVSNFIAIDEGFGALDADKRESVQSLLQAISEQSRIIFVTHIPELAEVADNRLYVRRDGDSSIIEDADLA